MSGRIEQRSMLRVEEELTDAIVIVRGGRDTADKLRTHAVRTARAWSLDGSPLLGISVFATVQVSLPTLLRARFGTFRNVHLTAAGRLKEEFELLPTGRTPHFTVRLRSADEVELNRLLAILGPARDNPEYGNFDPVEEA